MSPPSDGRVTFPGEFTWRFQSGTATRSFTLLHEAGHDTGVFGDDVSDLAANTSHSLDVIRSCGY
jgi:hypothetical protein